MKRLNLELPKFRLELRYKLVKRRKPLVPEPLVPSVKTINRKYRSGTVLGKFVRHLASHRNTRRVFAGNLAAVVIATAFIPGAKIEVSAQAEENIIQVENTLTTIKGIQFPVDAVQVSQGYTFYHQALDLRDPIGTPVKPIKEGVVSFAGYKTGGYGNLIILDHSNGIESYYAHLSKIEVKEGQEVNTKTEIGQIGVTGRTTGAHLHLEIYNNGSRVNPLLVLPR
jgi:murein DD-endopeptidase MepM/ murein hydrolase activator NlpD